MVIYQLTKQKERVSVYFIKSVLSIVSVVLLKHIFILIYFSRIFIIYFFFFDVTI